jgi:hypothetical protein
MKDIEKRIMYYIGSCHTEEISILPEVIVKMVQQDFAKEIEKGIVRELINPKDVQYETSWNSALKRANELIKTLAGLE